LFPKIRLPKLDYLITPVILHPTGNENFVYLSITTISYIFMQQHARNTALSYDYMNILHMDSSICDRSAPPVRLADNSLSIYALRLRHIIVRAILPQKGKSHFS
jgi:hypothetical protein